MSARPFDPRRLDIEAFAADAGTLAGAWPLLGFERLAGSVLVPDDGSASDVAWEAEGERTRATGGGTETWLHLRAHAQVALECQRCLMPVAAQLEVDRRFRFVEGEDAAEALDAETDDHDVLATSRTFDLHELVEDELLLALPLVPRHDVCPQPLTSAAATEDDALPNPFAALADWKRRGPTT